MSGKKLTLTPLQMRKQLLIAESEINRTLLIRDCHAMVGEIHSATHLLGKASALFLSAKALMTLFKSRSTEPGAKAEHKRSFLGISLNLLRLGLPLWFGFHQKKAAANGNGQQSRAKAHEPA